MVNVADLVLGVKEKKEFELFDKIKFICKNFGEEYHKNRMDCYLYEVDNLEMYFIQKDSSSKSTLQNVSIRNTNTDFLNFDYLYDLSLKKGNLNKYVQGNWEKLVEQHYEMSLENIKEQIKKSK